MTTRLDLLQQLGKVSGIKQPIPDLARISYQNDNPSLDPCYDKKFSSLGNTVRIPLGQKRAREHKSLGYHLALY